MAHWKKTTKTVLLYLLIITSLLIIAIPITAISSIALLEGEEEDTIGLKELKGPINIPRLGQESAASFNLGRSSVSSQYIAEKLPNFAIGAQVGTGGGDIEIQDSLNLTSTELLSTQNSLSGSTGLPTGRETSRTVSDIPNFTKQDLLFNISEVTAEADWRLQENRVGGRTWDSDPVNGDDYHHIAISFNISEDYANLTGVRIRISLYAAGSGPSGLIYITNASSGAPDVNLTNKVALSQSLAWRTYTFSEDLVIEKSQTYFVVMESTFSDENNFWIWNYELNNDYETNGGDVYNRHFGGGWESEDGTDLPLQIQILPVEQSGDIKTYGSADDIEILYNTTAGQRRLTSFSWFDANTTEKHNFISNTSVSFTLDFIGNFTYTTAPITGVTSYSVQNNSISLWNITFSTAKVSTNYSVINHLISIKEIAGDWNGTRIYWNDSTSPEYPDLTNDVNVTWDGNPTHKYTHGNTTIYVNASTLAVNTTWHVWFEAPNYIGEFNWFDQTIGSNVTFATSIDTLEPKITFRTPNEGGYNFSVWIESYSGKRIYTDSNNNLGEIVNNWNITQTTSTLPETNGTYQTYAFWENTTENQVGFYTRNITVFVHTTPIIFAPTEVIEDTSLEIIAYYNATHNSTGINNANVTGVPDWGDQKPVQFEQFNSPHGYYNYTWDINSSHLAGQELKVTIFLEIPWHINHTSIWNTSVVYTSNITTIDVPNPLILEYGQSYTLRVNYSSGTTFISGATMSVDGDNENDTEELNYYSYQLFSTNYNSGESYSNLVVHFNKSGYLTQEIYFNLTITAGPTTVQQAYTPIIPSIYYTESYSFTLYYQNTVDNEGITDATYTTNHSSVIDFWYSNSSGYYFFNLSTSSLTLGSHGINIALNHTVYQENFILLTFNIVEMPTQILDQHTISSNQIMVEETITVTITEFLTYNSNQITSIDDISLLLNDSFVDNSYLSFVTNAPFSVELDTTGIQYGKYNLSVILEVYGYENQAISFNVTLNGYETEISVEIEPGKNIQQGEDVIFIATLVYVSGGGTGAEVTQQVPLEGIDITFFVIIEYENGTTRTYDSISQTDNLNYQATYTIDGIFTKNAIKFTNITIHSGSTLSGLPYTYSMSTSELDTYQILPPVVDIFEVIITVLTVVVVVLIALFIAVTTVRVYRRRRRVHKLRIQRQDIAVEQSFEDIKSIRLILARHQSGLQFYSEKTIAELQTDTDALSGMSAALSSFMEELSESMSSQSEEKSEKDKIEFLSREGLHMLIWHGYHSSFIIISETRLPEYFQTHLKALGHELEQKYLAELQDFYSSDQIPNTVVKKMVRKYIPLHYFSAYVLNEGVLTLESVKLSRKYTKMFKEIKKVMFHIEGAQYFFSEQIISHLSKDYKRSEAIEFLDHAITINLLIEAEQKDLLQLTQQKGN